jgi:ABC-type nickel/cobalt efflux system permease component RcnA
VFGAVTIADAPPTTRTEVTPGRGGVWVMGLVGGLVPSPSALLLLLAAVALGRAWFGVVLVLAFGIGMAFSLAAVGLLARGLVLRLEGLALRRGYLGGQVRTFLRYGAMVGICAVGLGVIVRAVLQL